MKLHELKPVEGARKSRKRVGRGMSSGHGKTSGRGHKGQNARTGGGVGLVFEGGQLPLFRAIPKRGFTNNWRKEYTVINVSLLEQFDNNTTITAEFLKSKGVVSKIQPYGLKVIGNGELTKALNVKAAKFSQSAIDKITKAGGSVEVI